MLTLHQIEEELGDGEGWEPFCPDDNDFPPNFTVRCDANKSIRAIIHDLFAQVLKRQKENPGIMYADAVLQHLVGAKLSLILPPDTVSHHEFSVAGAASSRSGDFIIGDVIIHVTTSPNEALMRKCLDNFKDGAHPIVITTTTHNALAAGEFMAAVQGIEERVDFFEAEQFLATSVYPFTAMERRITIEKLIEKYNEIIEQCEPDPSLRITVG